MTTKARLIRMTRGGGGAPALRLVGAPVSVALEGQLYPGFDLAISGGIEPYSLEVSGGPAGLDLSGSGSSWNYGAGDTPTEDGSFAVLFTATDSSTPAKTATLFFTLDVQVPATPPFPSSQTIAWPGKTLKGFYAHDMGYTGSGTLEITSQVNGGGAVTLWTLTGNKITPVGTWGTAAPTYSGPYTVVVTDGTFSSTITLNIDANAFGVASDAELSRVIAQTNCTVNYGDEIRCRPGEYASAAKLTLRKASQWSDANAIGAPTSYDDAGWVTITSDGDRASTFRFVELSCTLVAAQYLRFTNLKFERFNTAGSSPGATNSLQIISTSGVRAASWVRVDDNEICSRVEDGTTNIASGVRAPSALNGVSNIFIHDNHIHDVYDGITIIGDSCEIIGNLIERAYNDGVKGLRTASKNNWNIIRDKRIFPGTGQHGDFMQEDWATVAPGTYVGSEYIGNILARGAGVTGGTDGQGIFVKGQAEGVVVTGAVCRGNLIINGKVNAIYYNRHEDLDLSWNTCVSADEIDEGTTNRLIKADNSTGSARFNVSETFGLTGLSPSTPNKTVSRAGGSYAAAFADPVRDEEDDIATLLTRWAMKAGGALDLAANGDAAHSGAVGTGYVDYGARTTSFPAV